MIYEWLQTWNTETPNNRAARDAQEHLSKLDKNLVRGHFDKGDFNHAIDDLKSILDHNTLQPSTRDTLMRDMSDLKVARDRRY
jgi:hypothetical protein